MHKPITPEEIKKTLYFWMEQQIGEELKTSIHLFGLVSFNTDTNFGIDNQYYQYLDRSAHLELEQSKHTLCDRLHLQQWRQPEARYFVEIDISTWREGEMGRLTVSRGN